MSSYQRLTEMQHRTYKTAMPALFQIFAIQSSKNRSKTLPSFTLHLSRERKRSKSSTTFGGEKSVQERIPYNIQNRPVHLFQSYIKRRQMKMADHGRIPRNDPDPSVNEIVNLLQTKLQFDRDKTGCGTIILVFSLSFTQFFFYL
ncbi:hypothetical protein NPIL_312251 [Nephila pilipes]|uniref:Uncharacterized protein n=1 Tax=Nephila pilipes TaxID=299642 RepID=A0A8X6NRH4_NEPPI|nr:hypothetical protein NPIL_312251 [Nephila pilipes]